MVPKPGDKIWNTYFVSRVSPRTLAVGSATIKEIDVDVRGYHTEYHVKLVYDENDSVAAFGDKHRKDEQKYFWTLYLTAEAAIEAYIHTYLADLREVQRNIDEATLLFKALSTLPK